MRTSIIQIVTITLMLIPCLPFIQAEPENYFRLTLHYNNGTISMKTLVVLPLALPTAKGSGDFTANLVSFENNTLNSTTFGFPRQVFYDSWNEETGEISGGGVFLLDEADEMVSLPYYSNAKQIMIYNESGAKQLVIDVSSFAIEKPVVFETPLPEKKVTSTVPGEVEVESQTLKNVALGIGLGLGLLVLLVLILFLWRRKRGL